MIRAHLRGPIARLLLAAAASPALAGQDLPAGSWMADARFETSRSITDLALGAVQGVVVREGRIYAYGDLIFARPRVGVIREYKLDLEPTGRTVALTRGGAPLIVHPTGLTWHDRWGTFLGDTPPGPATRKPGVIYRLDWARAWADGNLDNAVRDVIIDDAARNGCRPEFVTVDGRHLIATADYGADAPELRLYDPAAMLESHTTTAEGVIVDRIPCGPFNQNLHWMAAEKRLVFVQNVVEGRGWRLLEVDLATALRDRTADSPDAIISTRTFRHDDELEGYFTLSGGQALLAVARRENNLLKGRIEAVAPFGVTVPRVARSRPAPVAP